jgi:hypothetical protein
MRYTIIRVERGDYTYTDTAYKETILQKLSEKEKTELRTNNYILFLFSLEDNSYDPELYMIFTEQHPLFNILVMREGEHELYYNAYDAAINIIRSYNRSIRLLFKEIYLKTAKI